MERTLLKILGPMLVVFFLLVMQITPTFAQTPSKEQAPETQAGQSGSTVETKSPSPGPYSGDFWHRSTLTGDWGGFRNDLAAKGVTTDISLIII